MVCGWLDDYLLTSLLAAAYLLFFSSRSDMFIGRLFLKLHHFYGLGNWNRSLVFFIAQYVIEFVTQVGVAEAWKKSVLKIFIVW